MSFSELGLNQTLQTAVANSGYTTPTPIQARGIPAVLAGRDVLAAAQTGTGKTAAFTLPILQKLGDVGDKRGRKPRVLVLTPTRELAAQVAESVHTYGRGLPVRTAVIFGGVGFGPQVDAFRRGLDIIVATPGRLLDHVRQGNVDLSAIEMLVLDEADRMLDMGFIHDIRRVIERLPAKRQNLLFSATFSGDIRKLARTLLNNPEEIDVAPRNAPTELVDQKVVFVPKSRKRALLSWLIGSNNWRQVLVFTRTKHGANRLCKQLENDGLSAAALHGNKSQGARTKALDGFKSGSVRVLVATDIAARGIDIDALPHVINFELPNVPEDYIHRIGRTGRAGSEGEALALVDGEEKTYLRDIQRLLKREIPVLTIEGFDLQAQVAQREDEVDPRQSQGNRRPGSNPGRPGAPPRRKRGGNRGRGARRQGSN
ncbi:DEAD/DEAH box helicase [Spectribacter hydrogenooxidans]|uniref:DEAD/DEAH box helicase n=1 Tax=Spectribacter hydrogenoxidans TaxID=3075608 RepID=A0ABU3C179_9GAMM|nr:DEAD/DEAH box helicase [Salinisphaera sp. W335]MDT0635312.1 DEAD/DEAH box helicase [Salinisphaera sp. W335]